MIQAQTCVQQLFEQIWTASTLNDLLRFCQQLIEMLPQNIIAGEGLKGMDQSRLETCSQLDFIICLALRQLAVMTEEIPWEESVMKRKKKLRDRPEYSKYGLPMVRKVQMTYL